MKYSEKIIEQLLKIVERDRVPLFEACVTYCEENDIEEEELVTWLDTETIAMLQQSAVDANKVRRCVRPRESELEFT